MDKSNIWFITPKTNLHVGNENTTSYGLIDLAVQRNATTGLPCINSSSLKGALSEYAAMELNMTPDDLVGIFGSDKKKGEGRRKDTQKGQYTFFDANILFLPVQDDETLYHLETSHDVIRRFRNQMALFGIQLNQDDEALKEELKKALNIQKEVIFSKDAEKQESDALFIDLCSDDNLPIIARNVLDNGESKNLWYEQVVPAETVFYTLIIGNNSLEEKLNNAIVQIGADATIGYGYCKFTNLK